MTRSDNSRVTVWRMCASQTYLLFARMKLQIIPFVMLFMIFTLNLKVNNVINVMMQMIFSSVVR